MKLIDGRLLASQHKAELKEEVGKLLRRPKLAIIQVGTRNDSSLYITLKRKACEEIGILFELIILEENISEDDLLVTITKLNNDTALDGLLVQLPLPDHLDECRMTEAISSEKDVDGLHPLNLGLLCNLKNSGPLLKPVTPQGIIYALKEFLRSEEDSSLSGKNVVIIGRGPLVGLPLSLMLLREDCTVTVCHTHTKNIKEITSNPIVDILIVACGVPEMITSEWIHSDMIVIDLGISYKDNKMVGDVYFFQCKDIARAITPVPGGIGPLTISMLMQNVVLSAKHHIHLQ